MAERAYPPITRRDLRKLLAGSQARLRAHFVDGQGRKWQRWYDFDRPLAVALCQGAALHYVDLTNGVKDFDVWFFYPFHTRHLPYRTVWRWDFGPGRIRRHPGEASVTGRVVDVIMRSIHEMMPERPVVSLQRYLEGGQTPSARALAQKAVVLLAPERLLGRVVWYRGSVET